MVKVGDIRRFEHPLQLMAYISLVPSKRQTGDSIRRGGITKTGNALGYARTGRRVRLILLAHPVEA